MQLKFEIEYEHVAFIVNEKGQSVPVGTVEVYEEDKEKKTTSVLVKFIKGLPVEVQNAIKTEPRMLKFAKVANKSTGIVLLPEIGD